jgi:hypothetical protein
MVLSATKCCHDSVNETWCESFHTYSKQTESQSQWNHQHSCQLLMTVQHAQMFEHAPSSKTWTPAQLQYMLKFVLHWNQTRSRSDALLCQQRTRLQQEYHNRGSNRSFTVVLLSVKERDSNKSCSSGSDPKSPIQTAAMEWFVSISSSNIILFPYP